MFQKRPLLAALLATISVITVAFGALGLGSDERVAAHAQQAGATTTIQLLMYNDFQGALQPPAGAAGRIVTAAGPVDAGGAVYLAKHLATLKATNPNTVVVSGGDLFGGSPFLSGLFRDEPTVEVANLMGTQINTVGNLEFDKGVDELKRLAFGGCIPEGCKVNQFKGSNFKYLSGNVIETATGKPLFPGYEIMSIDGVKVAFIGVTTKTAPSVVRASGVAGLQFKDEAETINALIPEVEAADATAIVLVIHEGATTTDFATGGYDACTGFSGVLAGILTKVTSGKVDVVLSANSQVGYNCVVDGRVVVQAASLGRLISKVDLTIDRATGKVTKAVGKNQIVTRDVTPDPAVAALLETYTNASAPLAGRIVGRIAQDLTRTASASGETAAGALVADAQLAATTASDKGAAVISFTNPGGVRADFTFAQSKSEGAGVVTFEEAFNVQPFGNHLVTLTLTGAQIKTLLDQQWTNNAAAPRILPVSKGFSYAWDASRPDAEKVDAASLKLNGVAIDPNGKYRVTVHGFLASGGDNFTILRDGQDRLVGELDIDALERYLKENSPVPLPAANRIVVRNAAPASPSPAATATPPAPLPPSTGSGQAGEGLSVMVILAGLAVLALGGALAATSRRR